MLLLIAHMPGVLAGGPGDGRGPGWPGWWIGPLLAVLWLTLIGTVVWLVTRQRRQPEPSGLDHARSLLAERYARGDLSTDEYRERLDNLR